MTGAEQLLRLVQLFTEPLQKDELEHIHLCWNPHRGYCGIQRMAFTVGLWYNINSNGVGEGRYCYHTMAEAVQALNEWTGIGDAPGDWIKHKGLKEYSHPDSTDPFAIKPY